MNRRVKRSLQASVGILVALVFLYLSVRNIDIGDFWQRLKSVSLTYFFPILLTLVAFFWIKAIRWSCLVRPLRRLSAREVLPALMIGFMGNNVLPAHLGEFVRMAVLAKQYDLSKSSVLSTIVLERVLDFLAIIGLFAVTLQFIPLSEELEVVRTASYVIGLACVVVFALFTVTVWQTARAIRMTERLLVVLPTRLRRKLLEVLHLGVDGLRALRNPWLFLGIFGLTVVHWGINGLGLYLAAISFPLAEPLPFLAGFVLMGVTALGVTLPSAPGYFGTVQYCFVLSLAIFGVERETALAASCYGLLMSYVPVTLVGLYFVTSLGVKIGSVTKDAEAIRS